MINYSTDDDSSNSNDSTHSIKENNINPFNNNDSPFNNNNPFNNNDNQFNINNNFIDEKMEIWIEQFGKKKNTYLSGWKLPDKELKEHIKIFKRNHGCNGTLKINDDNIKVIMFQGDHINNIISYLEKIDIDVKNINIKGYDT